MTGSISKRRGALRDSAALVSCVMFAIAAAVPVGLIVAQGYTTLFALSPTTVLPGRHVLGLSAAMMVASVLGAYAGIVLWLCSARFVFGFTRAEVVRCSHAGPYTKFDHWLIARLYREENATVSPADGRRVR